MIPFYKSNLIEKSAIKRRKLQENTKRSQSEEKYDEKPKNIVFPRPPIIYSSIQAPAAEIKMKYTLESLMEKLENDK